MTEEENIRAILECNFAGYKEEIIENAVKRICELKHDSYYKDLANSYEKTINKLTKAISEQEPKTEPCDCISRAELLKAIDTWDKFGFEHTGCFVREPKDDFITYIHYDDVIKCIKGLPSVQPKTLEQESRKGEWLRMSDLQEQEDDRYKCSCCGNVVHYTNKMNLYTFNSWCGRCGSDNGVHINYEVEE